MSLFRLSHGEAALPERRAYGAPLEVSTATEGTREASVPCGQAGLPRRYPAKNGQTTPRAPAT